MSQNVLNDGVEYLLSQFPEEVVTHFANSQREFLLGVQACVDRGVNRAIEELDARVQGAQRRREERQKAEKKPNGTRITIEEEEGAGAAEA